MIFLLIAYGLITFLIGLITVMVIYGRWYYGELEKLNIPVIKPSFLFGSRPNMYKKIVHEEDSQLTNKLGTIWGMYEGREPFVFVSDLDLIRLIFIKDFDHFHDKRSFDLKMPLINEMLDMQPGDKWKALRNALTPTFTTGKIKYMSQMISEACQNTVQFLREETMEEGGKSFDFKRFYIGLTADSISRAVFATKFNALRDPNNIFFKNIEKLNFDNGDEMNFMFTFVSTFPIFMDFFPGIMAPEVVEFWRQILEKIVKERQESGIPHGDFVDTMVELLKEVNSPEFEKLGISRTTILSQSLLFLFAGYDTTAITLTMLSYNLATNPDVQERLLSEIDNFYEEHSEANYSNIGEMPFLHACVNETLRLCAPLIRLERKCMKDWKDPQGRLAIKKGMVVQVPVWSIHLNPQYYPDPLKFNPERFLPENKDKLTPYTFLSFGVGPHNCIGNRFALEVVKLSMASILKEFEFKATEETKLKFRTGRTFLVLPEPIKGKIVRRNH